MTLDGKIIGLENEFNKRNTNGNIWSRNPNMQDEIDSFIRYKKNDIPISKNENEILNEILKYNIEHNREKKLLELTTSDKLRSLKGVKGVSKIVVNKIDKILNFGEQKNENTEKKRLDFKKIISGYIGNLDKYNSEVLITTFERERIEEMFSTYSNNEILSIVGEKLLKKLRSSIHKSQYFLIERIDSILKKNDNDKNRKFIEYISNSDILKVFNKTSKGRKLLSFVAKYSPISIEKMASYIEEASKQFDVPSKYIIAIIVGESDVAKKRNPFRVNPKGIGQFLRKTFKGLYSTIKWAGPKGKRSTTQGDVRHFFNRKGLKKYANNVKKIGINKISDRYNPKKSILAIAAYLKYISLVKKGRTLDTSLARYNVGPFGTIGNNEHFKKNPVIKKEYYKKFKGRIHPITNEKVVLAAKQYYGNLITIKNRKN